MKIALFSDIHGNLPALEAVLAAIDELGPDKIFCLGDLVNFAPFTNQVIELIRRRNIPTIMGNHDDGIGNRKQHFMFSGSTEKELSAGQIAIAYTNRVITQENREFLRSLPPFLHISTGEDMGYLDLLLAHGSPRDNDEFVNEDYDADALLKMMAFYHADLLAIGHTHMPYLRILPGEDFSHRLHKQVINAGSVGRPTDGDWRACFCILELQAGSNLQDAASIKVDFHRKAYDIEKTCAAILQSPIPDLFADTLRQAGLKPQYHE